VVQQLRDCVAARDLATIHNEHMMLNIAVTTLLQHDSIAGAEKRNDLQVMLVSFGRRVAGLHAAADAGDQARSEQQLQIVLAAFDEITALCGEELLKPARTMAERRTYPMHADVIGKRGDLCPKCGMLLDQLV